jgi:hypothetical protein
VSHSFPPTICGAGSRVASSPPLRLPIADIMQRFGIPHQTLILLCNRHPEIAIREQGVGGYTGWRWLIDVAALGLLRERRMIAAIPDAVRRFNVDPEVFAGLNGGQIAVLMATLPIEPRRPKGRRRRIPPDAAPLPGEVRHEAS